MSGEGLFCFSRRKTAGSIVIVHKSAPHISCAKVHKFFISLKFIFEITVKNALK